MGSLLIAIGQSSKAWFQSFAPAKSRLLPAARLLRLVDVLGTLSRSDEASETRLAERFEALELTGELSDYEEVAFSRLKALMQLRRLAFGHSVGENRWIQGFVAADGVMPFPLDQGESLEVKHVTEAAAKASLLYWKLLEACEGRWPELEGLARGLYLQLFGQEYSTPVARKHILRLTDRMQIGGGLPFLFLNLLRLGATEDARWIGREIQVQGLAFEDEEWATALYWMGELSWFGETWQDKSLSFESSLRYLYHLCFSAPDRAAFLEIDSHYFGEFEAVNELAREAFSYRETLMEKVLDLWAAFDGQFDALFSKTLETVSGLQSHLPDQREAWSSHWTEHQQDFSQEYLSVIEGNLAYLAGAYDQAADCFERALEHNAQMRTASRNLLFCYARLGRKASLDALCERLMEDASPSALASMGNAYLILGDMDGADAMYEKLVEQPGWARRADFYRSLFCYQNGLWEEALRSALIARAAKPADAAVAHHLSLCYEAVGQREEALEALDGIDWTPDMHWLLFYRFSLECELERDEAAKRTLLQIHPESLDADEMEIAERFALRTQDLAVLRHVRKKTSR